MRQLQILKLNLRGVCLFGSAERQRDVRRLARGRDEMTQQHDRSGDNQDYHGAGSQRSRESASLLLIYFARFHFFLVSSTAK